MDGTMAPLGKCIHSTVDYHTLPNISNVSEELRSVGFLAWLIKIDVSERLMGPEGVLNISYTGTYLVTGEAGTK